MHKLFILICLSFSFTATPLSAGKKDKIPQALDESTEEITSASDATTAGVSHTHTSRGSLLAQAHLDALSASNSEMARNLATASTLSNHFDPPYQERTDLIVSTAPTGSQWKNREERSWTRREDNQGLMKRTFLSEYIPREGDIPPIFDKQIVINHPRKDFVISLRIHFHNSYILDDNVVSHMTDIGFIQEREDPHWFFCHAGDNAEEQLSRIHNINFCILPQLGGQARIFIVE